MLACLVTALTCEMSTHLFLRVFPERIGFYEHAELFGARVNKHFPNATKDIRAAGSCYATDRSTACVMHLMRVLEIGLAAFAKQFNVPFERREWENMINDIQSEIAAKYEKGKPTVDKDR